MKKTYISPAMDVTLVVAGQMIAASITGVEGPIGMGEGDTPTEADVKGNSYNVWDDDWQK